MTKPILCTKCNSELQGLIAFTDKQKLYECPECKARYTVKFKLVPIEIRELKGFKDGQNSAVT